MILLSEVRTIVSDHVSDKHQKAAYGAFEYVYMYTYNAMELLSSVVRRVSCIILYRVKTTPYRRSTVEGKVGGDWRVCDERKADGSNSLPIEKLLMDSTKQSY